MTGGVGAVGWGGAGGGLGAAGDLAPVPATRRFPPFLAEKCWAGRGPRSNLGFDGGLGIGIGTGYVAGHVAT